MKMLMKTFAMAASLLLLAACRTPVPEIQEVDPKAAFHSETISLREGDVIKIVFPGSPNLDTTEQIRRDGRIALPLVGEIQAAGLAPSDLEQEILKLYSSQLVSKVVNVSVVSSLLPVYVTGSVLHPGKVVADHPITALEAIMEGGGFDLLKANTKKVYVIRLENGERKRYTLDLKSEMKGHPTQLFYLKPSDIIYVPEKFQWF
jgi:polysaccharide biosynthesis/export protein